MNHHICIFRDNFYGINNSYINELLDKKVNNDTYVLMIKYIQKNLTKNILNILVTAIKSDNTTILNEFINNNNIINEPFKCIPAKRILVEIIQEDPEIRNFYKEINKKKYITFVEKFRIILPFLINKYAVEFNNLHHN